MHPRTERTLVSAALVLATSFALPALAGEEPEGPPPAPVRVEAARMESMADRVESYRELLLRKFSALEGVIGRLQSQQQFLSVFQFPNFNSK